MREVPIPAAIAPAFLGGELASEWPETTEAKPLPTAPKEFSWQLPSVHTLTRGAWLAGAIITVLPLVLGLWRVRRIRRRAQAWTSADALVEALRTMRLLHFNAWVARRWSDPAFPRAFPWFEEPRHWESVIAQLQEQLAALQEPVSLDAT